MVGCCFLEDCSFLKENREVDLGERGRCWQGVERGEAVVGMYSMREESIFTKTKE